MLDVLRKKPAPPPEHLLHRSYQNALRAIGRFADAEDHRSVALFEVQHGFILRAFPSADPVRIVAIEIPDDDIQDLILKDYGDRGRRDRDPKSTTLLPTGYEDFLRALGFFLDGKNARSVSLTEMADGFAVSFFELQTTNDGYFWHPQSFVMQHEHIKSLLDEASNRRH